MKKFLLLIVGMILFTFYACDNYEETVSDENSVVENTIKRNYIGCGLNNDGDGIYTGIGSETYNEACWGNGSCYSMPIAFGGGINVGLELLSNDKIRVHFYDELLQVNASDLEGMERFENQDLREVANFINTNYSFSKFIPFEESVNQSLVRAYRLERGSTFYVFPGYYKVITVGKRKHMDVSISIQDGGSEPAGSFVTPPQPWCNPGCSFEGWRSIPVNAPTGYVLVPDCSCE